MSFPRYPKYKPSGVEWLGDVPEHWEIWKLAHAFSIIGSGTTPKTDNRAYYDDGDIPWINTGDLNDGELDSCEKRITQQAVAEHTSLKLYPAGSLLIAMYGATIGKLGILRFPATVNQACCVFGGRSQIFARFMFYWFIGLRQQILSLATGGGQPNVSQDILRTLRVGCPDLDEQTAIAGFLDRETSKIDSLVGEQRRLIELLKEKRQAVISHAVTKGLNPNAPMKPSGIPWLGDVPEHWDVCQVRRIIRRIEQGWSPECMGRPAEIAEWGVMKTGCVNRGVFNADENKALPEELAPATEYEIRAGDVLVSRASGSPELVGSCALVQSVRPRLLLSDKTFRIHFEPMIETRYFVAAFNSGLMRNQIEQSISGADGLANNLPQATMKRFSITVPPKAEQQAIVEFLEAETGKLDALTAEAERAIELLQERRTALISAAVTGKIDVRSEGNLDNL